jgi:glycosyltransferase involved in cell wall biosynthesis
LATEARGDSDPGTSLDEARVVLDCRWLGLGGAGRVTELLLRELRAEPPPGRWTCWGRPETVEPLRFPRAALEPSTRSPLALRGQAELANVPDGDVVVYLHQIRPLRRGRSVTVIYDTIPLRHGGTAASRAAKRAFFRSVARRSTRLVTTSESSRARIHEDLGVPLEAITVVRLPVDLERARAVARLRDYTPQEDVLLYVGRFAPHKNLPRLAAAFGESRFAAEGGRLLLVGGWTEEIQPVQKLVADMGLRGVEVHGTCTERELDHLLATSRALIAPALEEGYGLPAYEAAASGLPVAASRAGAMAELAGERVVLFDPTRTDEIARAIDTVTSLGSGAPYEPSASTLRAGVLDSVAAALGETC